MFTSLRARLPLLVGAGIAGIAGLTACTFPGSAPSSSPSSSAPGPGRTTGPQKTGAAPAWTLSVPTGENTTVLVGGTVVIGNDKGLTGVDPRDGKRRWQISAGAGTISVAGDVVAFSAGGAVTMIDPADGKRLWTSRSKHALVTRDAVFGNDCAGSGRCTITRRDPRTGHVRWKASSKETQFGDTFVGVRPSMAPPTARYLASDYDPRANRWGARATATGRPAAGHVPAQAWSELVAGRNLISTNHDPPSGDDRCTVHLVANDIVTGRHRWTRDVFSGRKKDGECQKTLSDHDHGQSMIGTATRLAASTDDGRPQLFDLRAGRTIWRAKDEGVPIDGDAHGVLVRGRADTGPLRMLDFTTGRTRWTAPDPGLAGDSASWKTAVSDRLVAVSADTGDQVQVLIYDSATGRLRGRFPGWLEGLGDDWAAIGTTSENTPGSLKYDFIRY